MDVFHVEIRKSWKSKDPDSLSIKKGEVIVVFFEDDDHDRYMGERGDQKGWFPRKKAKKIEKMGNDDPLLAPSPGRSRSRTHGGSLGKRGRVRKTVRGLSFSSNAAEDVIHPPSKPGGDKQGSPVPAISITTTAATPGSPENSSSTPPITPISARFSRRRTRSRPLSMRFSRGRKGSIISDNPFASPPSNHSGAPSSPILPSEDGSPLARSSTDTGGSSKIKKHKRISRIRKKSIDGGRDGSGYGGTLRRNKSKRKGSFIDNKKLSLVSSPLEKVMDSQKASGGEHSRLKIPLLLDHLTSRLDACDAQHHKGIFRIPGNAERISELWKKLDEGTTILSILDADEDVDTLASLLKKYVRECEPPVIPYDMFRRGVECAENMEECASMVSSLPDHHRRFIRHLCRFLQSFTHPDCVEATLMGQENLCLVFGPSVLRFGDDVPLSEVLTASANQAKFISSLMVHYNTVETSDSSDHEENAEADAPPKDDGLSSAEKGNATDVQADSSRSNPSSNMDVSEILGNAAEEANADPLLMVPRECVDDGDSGLLKLSDQTKNVKKGKRREDKKASKSKRREEKKKKDAGKRKSRIGRRKGGKLSLDQPEIVADGEAGPQEAAPSPALVPPAPVGPVLTKTEILHRLADGEALEDVLAGSYHLDEEAGALFGKEMRKLQTKRAQMQLASNVLKRRAESLQDLLDPSVTGAQSSSSATPSSSTAVEDSPPALPPKPVLPLKPKIRKPMASKDASQPPMKPLEVPKGETGVSQDPMSPSLPPREISSEMSEMSSNEDEEVEDEEEDNDAEVKEEVEDGEEDNDAEVKEEVEDGEEVKEEEEDNDKEVKDEEINDEEIKDEEIKDVEVKNEEVNDEEVQDEEEENDDDEDNDEEVKDEEAKDEEIKDEEAKDEDVEDEEDRADTGENYASEAQDGIDDTASSDSFSSYQTSEEEGVALEVEAFEGFDKEELDKELQHVSARLSRRNGGDGEIGEDDGDDDDDGKDGDDDDDGKDGDDVSDDRDGEIDSSEGMADSVDQGVVEQGAEQKSPDHAPDVCGSGDGIGDAFNGDEEDKPSSGADGGVAKDTGVAGSRLISDTLNTSTPPITRLQREMAAFESRMDDHMAYVMAIEKRQQERSEAKEDVADVNEEGASVSPKEHVEKNVEVDVETQPAQEEDGKEGDGKGDVHHDERDDDGHGDVHHDERGDDGHDDDVDAESTKEDEQDADDAPLDDGNAPVTTMSHFDVAPETWDFLQVVAWLETQPPLATLAPLFAENRINGEVLTSLTQSDLKEMGVNALGDRKLILKRVSELDEAFKRRSKKKKKTGPKWKRKKSRAAGKDVEASESNDQMEDPLLLQ